MSDEMEHFAKQSEDMPVIFFKCLLSAVVAVFIHEMGPATFTDFHWSIHQDYLKK